MIIQNISAELNQELKKRHKKIQEFMQAQHIDACFLTGNMNLYYVTNRVVNGYFYLPCQGDAWLFAVQPGTISGERIARVTKPEMIPQILFAESDIEMPKRIALEQDEISAREFARISKLFDQSEIVSATELLRAARSVKTAYELEIIRKDCAKHAQLYHHIPELFQAGMTDVEFCAAIEHYFRKNGHLGIFRTFGFRMESYMGSLLAGDNASEPSPYDFSLGGSGSHASMPLGACGKLIKKNTTIHVDISGNFNGYVTDMTRTFSYGEIPQRAKALHQVSLDIQEAIMRIAKPGVLCSDLYALAQEIVSKANAADCFMGISKQAKFIGHGIGLEINELPVIAPRYNQPLEQGMCIALEPKFLIQGVGAVGSENTYEVTERGLSNLTQGNQEIIEL